MSQIITAIFEDGILKPEEALDLPPHTRVRLTVEPLDDDCVIPYICNADLRKLAAKYHPPQEWYDEDHEGLF